MNTLNRCMFFVVVLAFCSCKQERFYGARYFSDSKLDNWEYCLFEIPKECGQMTLRLAQLGPHNTPQEMNDSATWWLADDYRLNKQHNADEEIVRFSNPEYFAMVRTNNGKSRLQSVSGPISPDMCPDSPFRSSSTCSDNTSLIIPREIRNGNLKVIQFETRANQHFVTLVPNEELVGEKQASVLKDVKRIELVFDDDLPPLPVSRVLWTNYKKTSGDWMDHIELAPGFFLPQSIHANRVFTEREFKSKITYDISSKIDLNQCRLEYYGIEAPALQKQGNVWWWLCWTGALAFLISIYLLASRSSRAGLK